MKYLVTARIALFVAASLLVNGCAVPPPRQPDRPGDPAPSSPAQSIRDVCNPVIVGIGAALVCGALASGNKRVKTGAACAAAAVVACYLVNGYKSEQTRSAQQVEADYLQRNAQLPDRAVVTAYRSEVSPRGAVRRGQEVTVSSTIVAVPGRREPNVVIEEELGVLDSVGETWGKPVRKVANSGNQAGEYRTSFTIPVNDGMSQGVYLLRRSLYVNGVAVQRDDTGARFQVVQSADGLRWLALNRP